MATLAVGRRSSAEVHWVTRGEQVTYSGMLSGWVAGEYRSEACRLDLVPLARAAGVRLHPGGAAAVDARQRRVTLEGGEVLEADVLSLGVGSALRGAELPGVREHAWNVKALPARFERFPPPVGPSVVVGAGLAGIELALCLRAVADEVSLVSETETLPADAPPALARAVRRALETRGVHCVQGRAVAVTTEAVLLEDGRQVAARGVLWATGPAPHPLLRETGVALGPTGAVQVDVTLQSTSQPNLFAVGDCADLPTPSPKSGVYSVREGPVLAHNLAAALRGEALRAYRPQRAALALLNCGDGTALLSWGRFAARGRWLRTWKHRLDVGFLETLRRAGHRTVP
jgi:NADH dehydrogenase FAD-containing subunit